MTAPLDEKARDAALAAWFANTAQGWHAAMEAAIRAYLAASPSPSEMEVWERLQEAIDAFDADIADGWADAEQTGERPDLWPQETTVPIDLLRQAQSALAAMRAERDDSIATVKLLQEQFRKQQEHDTTLIETAEARIKALEEALSHALDHYDRNICMHESVHRGGSIWTICDDCGRQWADDKGGFQPHVDPAEISAARSALKENAL